MNKIHILGIAGTFMGGVAALARELGLEVEGSDQAVYPPMSTQLEQLGSELRQGYLAENIGATSLIYLKDERGLYSDDPKKAKAIEDLRFIDRISVSELINLDLDDLIVERPVLTFLKNAKCMKEFQVIDALRHPEHILAALRGEHVGTIVYKD